MGGTQSSRSKDAHYVLRIAEVEQPAAAASTFKPSPESHSQRGRRGSLTLSTALVAAGQTEHKTDSNAAPPASPKGRAELFAIAAPEPPGKLVRRHSVSGISLSPASNNFSNSLKIPPKKGQRNSDKCPWILKAATISAGSSNDFDIKRVIGTGLMGTVRIVKLKSSNSHFALKSVKKDYITRHRDQRHIDNEKAVLLQVRSHFCIKLFGAFQDNTNVYFAMELAAGGELFRRLSKKESFRPAVAKFYATEIFSALEHVQSLGYVYRDLKPENVMLDEDGHCKLVDFGFAVQPDAQGLIHTICGTPAYLSPEQLNGKFTNGYAKIVDWWSFGVFVFELLTGKTPFCKSNKESSYEIYIRILKTRISFPRSFDAASRDLIQNLCHAEVDKRLCTPEGIRAHAYFEVPWDLVAARRLVPPFVPRLTNEFDDHYFNDYGKDFDFDSLNDQKWDFDSFS